MIENIQAFTHYFESIRRRTLNYVCVIPADQIDWALKPGEFTCGDIVRHLAGTELMYVGVVVSGVWKYPGHDRTLAPSLEEGIAYLERCHQEAMYQLNGLLDGVLHESRPALAKDSPPIRAWRWLMAMVEHETHHRSQLATYLTVMGVEPPQIYGMGVEDVIALATG